MEIIDKVNDFLVKYNLKASPIESKEVKLMVEGVTSEGVVVASDADEWAEGVNVFVVVEGEETPAPDGEYTLEDGTTIVAENGTVVSVGAAVEEEETKEEFNAEESYKALTTEMGELRDLLKGFTENLEKAETEAKAEVEAKKEEAVNEEMEELKKQVEELSKQPATTSLNKQTTNNTIYANPPGKGAKAIDKILYQTSIR